jgi:hypothetical protein
MLGVRAGPIGGTLPSIPIVLSIFALASGFTIGCHPCARAARGRPRWPACGSGAGPGGRGRRTRASTQRGSRWSAEPARPGGRAQHGHRHLHDRRPLAVRAAGVHPGQAGGVDEPEVAVQGQVARPVGGGPEQPAQPVDVVPAQVGPEGLGRCRLAVGRAAVRPSRAGTTRRSPGRPAPTRPPARPARRVGRGRRRRPAAAPAAPRSRPRRPPRRARPCCRSSAAPAPRTRRRPRPPRPPRPPDRSPRRRRPLPRRGSRNGVAARPGAGGGAGRLGSPGQALSY